MQRKVAYVFLYKNGIRERSVGIVRRYGTAEQPEVALELFGKELQDRRWEIYYFTKGGALAEATYLWGSTTERGTSEVRMDQCRLCAEAGAGEGIVLLPAKETGSEKKGTEQETERQTEQRHCGRTELCLEDRSVSVKMEKVTDVRALREYLCARYDGKEVTADELRGAFRRKPEKEATENPCVESAKRLMEEITKAAGGELKEEGEIAGKQREIFVSEKEQAFPLHRKAKSAMIKNPEKIMRTNPPYTPCRGSRMDYSVRITPEDLQCLQTENRGYTENSYLLHGYYRYRHMLLGRRTGKEKVEYVLMIPGIYTEKEAGLAKMFGFPEFLPVKKTKPETGSAASGGDLFGYFCGKI